MIFDGLYKTNLQSDLDIPITSKIASVRYGWSHYKLQNPILLIAPLFEKTQ